MQRRPYLGLSLVFIIFIIVGFFVVRGIFGNSRVDRNKQTTETSQSKSLISNGTEVKYTVYGRLVGEEDRRAIRITVNDSMRRVEVLQGYDETVTQSKLYSNKSSAFDALKVALGAANFTLHDTSITRDVRGVCPLGQTYIYETDYDEGDDIRSWSTSCSTKNTSFKGNADIVEQLFQDQIPDYDKLTDNVNL